MVLFGVAALVSPVHGWLADQAGYRALWLVCAVCGAVCLLLTLPELRHRRSHEAQR
jgi:predicted MFS family arabinose efflux permease